MTPYFAELLTFTWGLEEEVKIYDEYYNGIKLLKGNMSILSVHFWTTS